MVEPSRAYRSALREGQARATRRRIVEAGRDLFIEQGYARTTVDAIAAGAGVSRRTVFTSVGGKVGVLKLAWDWALVGDDEPVPMADRPEIRELMAQTDPAVLVEMWAQLMARIAVRLAPLYPVLQVAADVDAEAADLNAESERNRSGGAAAFVEHLVELGGLRPDLDPDRARQIAEVLMDPVPARRLVLDGGWTIEEYAALLVRMARPSLLPDKPIRPAGRRRG